MKKCFIAILLCYLSVSTRAQWNYQIPFPKSLEPQQDTVSIVFIGDVMMHARQLEYDFRTFLPHISDILTNADIAVANMEFTLAGEPYTGYPCFSAPDGYASYLADCGTDIFLTANNHILDKGSKGLSRTLDIYRSMWSEGRIQFTGSGRDEEEYEAVNPLIVNSKGLKFAIINFTYGTNLGGTSQWPRVSRMDKDEIARQISAAKAKEADFIIALPHWGNEYQLKHSAQQQSWAQWLVEEGADLVIGAHPHVVQDTTHISGVPVIYSMGNAVSNMSAVNTRLELAVRARFVTGSKEGPEMLEPELIFLWCTLPGTLTDSYTTIPVGRFTGRRSEWKSPHDYDNMTGTLNRVTGATGIYYNEEDNQAGSN